MGISSISPARIPFNTLRLSLCLLSKDVASSCAEIPSSRIKSSNGMFFCFHITVPFQFWQGQRVSNPRPAVLETAALPTELYPCIHATKKARSFRDGPFRETSSNSHRKTAAAQDRPGFATPSCRACSGSHCFIPSLLHLATTLIGQSHKEVTWSTLPFRFLLFFFAGQSWSLTC